jgi:hypothetical protein
MTPFMARGAMYTLSCGVNGLAKAVSTLMLRPYPMLAAVSLGAILILSVTMNPGLIRGGQVRGAVEGRRARDSFRIDDTSGGVVVVDGGQHQHAEQERRRSAQEPDRTSHSVTDQPTVATADEVTPHLDPVH